MSNVKNALLDSIIKNSKIKEASSLEKSKYMGGQKSLKTSIPIFNIALSGRLDKGLSAGLGVLAAPSKHFKSLMGLILVKDYLDTHPDGVCVFYDSEFGSSMEYFKSVGVDTTRVVHKPISNLEEFKVDIANLLETVQYDDNVIILMDSYGNLASRKESEDALSGNEAQDMTRAKVGKGVFRIITPKLIMKNIPMIVINHVYQEIGMFPKTIISGGTGILYSANWAWIIGKRQVKTGKELDGFEFVINIEKSRHVIEKSQFILNVGFNSGIYKYSGLLEVAEKTGFIVKPSNGWYAHKDDPEKKYRKADLPTLFDMLLLDPEFNDAVQKAYSLEGTKLIDETEIMEHDDEDSAEVSDLSEQE